MVQSLFGVQYEGVYIRDQIAHELMHWGQVQNAGIFACKHFLEWKRVWFDFAKFIWMSPVNNRNQHWFEQWDKAANSL